MSKSNLGVTPPSCPRRKGGVSSQQGTLLLRPSRKQRGNSTGQLLNTCCTLKVHELSLGCHDSTGKLVLVCTRRLNGCSSSREINTGIAAALKSRLPHPTPLSLYNLYLTDERNPCTETCLSSQMTPCFPNVFSILRMMRYFIPKLANCSSHHQFLHSCLPLAEKWSGTAD